MGVGRSFHQPGVVNENVLESHFEPLCDGTTKCSMVAKTIQRFNRTGSTQKRSRHGRPKKLSAHAQRHIQMFCLGNRRMSAASIAAEVEGVWGQPRGTVRGGKVVTILRARRWEGPPREKRDFYRGER